MKYAAAVSSKKFMMKSYLKSKKGEKSIESIVDEAIEKAMVLVKKEPERVLNEEPIISFK